MKTMKFPGSFLVGHDILKDFTSLSSCFGSSFAFVGGRRSLAAAKSELQKSFEHTDYRCAFLECGKVACPEEIARIDALPEIAQADVLCAVGGGSCMDIVRTIANRRKKALIMIPTTVASDAPCSCVTVFYNAEATAVVGDELYHKCPDMVLIDSRIIANAPARHLAAGMGDALATWYEAATNLRGHQGARFTNTAMMLCQLARDLVRRDGPAAYAAVQEHIVTPQLENIIEANCFLSGVGGANTGCAAAHGIGDFLVSLPNGESYMHGERVYIGLMIQLILEQYPADLIRDMMDFGRKVGLPICIGDMGVTDIEETAYRLARGLENDHFMVNLTCDHSVDIVAGAICYAQHLAEQY